MMKKKKLLKISALIMAIILICGLCVFANMFVGNPVSRLIASKKAAGYLKDNFPDTDYVVEDVHYSFKDGCYYARISIPNSTDNHFNLCYNSIGKLRYCDYETSVKNKQNTAYRVMDEYRKAITAIIENAVENSSVSGMLLLDYDGNSYLKSSDLKMDKDYDFTELMELGRLGGSVYVYITDDTDASAEKAAEYLMEIKKTVDEQGGAFYNISMNFIGQSKSLFIYDFPYSEIYEEGLVERIQAAVEKVQSVYQDK